MIRHILLLQPRPDATSQEIEACRQAITSLVGNIPGLVDCHWGPNEAPAERRDGLSYGVSMDFADQASLDAYGPHPDHRQVVAKVQATFERIVVLDLPL